MITTTSNFDVYLEQDLADNADDHPEPLVTISALTEEAIPVAQSAQKSDMASYPPGSLSSTRSQASSVQSGNSSKISWLTRTFSMKAQDGGTYDERPPPISRTLRLSCTLPALNFASWDFPQEARKKVLRAHKELVTDLLRGQNCLVDACLSSDRDASDGDSEVRDKTMVEQSLKAAAPAHRRKSRHAAATASVASTNGVENPSADPSHDGFFSRRSDSRASIKKHYPAKSIKGSVRSSSFSGDPSTQDYTHIFSSITDAKGPHAPREAGPSVDDAPESTSKDKDRNGEYNFANDISEDMRREVLHSSMHQLHEIETAPHPIDELDTLTERCRIRHVSVASLRELGSAFRKSPNGNMRYSDIEISTTESTRNPSLVPEPWRNGHGSCGDMYRESDYNLSTQQSPVIKRMHTDSELVTTMKSE